jgi:hypothetical protein
VCAYVFAATHTEAFDFVKRSVAVVCGDSFDHRPHIHDLLFLAVSFHLLLFVCLSKSQSMCRRRAKYKRTTQNGHEKATSFSNKDKREGDSRDWVEGFSTREIPGLSEPDSSPYTCTTRVSVHEIR